MVGSHNNNAYIRLNLTKGEKEHVYKIIKIGSGFYFILSLNKRKKKKKNVVNARYSMDIVIDIVERGTFACKFCLIFKSKS